MIKMDQLDEQLKALLDMVLAEKIRQALEEVKAAKWALLDHDIERVRKHLDKAMEVLQ